MSTPSTPIKRKATIETLRQLSPSSSPSPAKTPRYEANRSTLSSPLKSLQIFEKAIVAVIGMHNY